MSETNDDRLRQAAFLAQNSFIGFCQLVYFGFKDWNHTHKICNFLERIESGEIQNGIITIPPQHGKSTCVSELFPAWLLGRNPHLNIILITYAAEKAEEWGRKIKNVINNEIYKLVFPETILASDSRANSKFNTTKGGGFIGVGVDGGITGNPADYIILDDTIKTYVQACSTVYMKRLHDLWPSCIESRIRNHTRVIMMHTRWKTDDMIGHSKKKYEGMGWKELSLPAIGKDTNGNEFSLCPEILSLEKLQERRENNPEMFAALYQQNPTIDGGNIVKSEWWKFYDEKPPFFSALNQYWDLNGEKGENNAMTHGVVWGMVQGKTPRENKVYLIDEVRDQCEFSEQEPLFWELTKRNPNAYEKVIENKSNGGALISTIRKKVSGVRPFDPRGLGDKPTRLKSVTPYIKEGRVFLPNPRFHPWVTDFINELATFPNGMYADRVDTTFMALFDLLGAWDETSDASYFDHINK